MLVPPLWHTTGDAAQRPHHAPLACPTPAAGCPGVPTSTRRRFFGAVHQQQPAQSAHQVSTDQRAALRAAIDRAASYLADACDEQGKFTYLVDLHGGQVDGTQYNVVRHAGTIYALAQYNRRSGTEATRAAMVRAAGFLRQQCIAPAAENPNFLAVWSQPQWVGPGQPRQAKLGATGLGLVALVHVEQVAPGVTSLDELRKLGRFLIYMQKSDGSFHSKYYAQTGRSDLWQSMYYPGEAALGLLLLYQQDPSRQWLHAATQALEYLAAQGQHQHPTLPDQWYLLAMDPWYALGARHYEDDTGNRLLDHVRHLCRDMLKEQQAQWQNETLRGCFTPEGRTCPTATRLEGLLAARRYLPADDPMCPLLEPALEQGMAFLLASQVTEGPYAGALPRFAPQFDSPNVSPSEEDRVGEVRIDYVQHALSAMIAYEHWRFGE